MIELVGDHTFSKVPTELLLDPAISNDAKVVFAVLYDRGRTPERCFPSYRWMAERMKASQRSIPKWVRELEESGWVQRVVRYREDHSQTSNSYRLYLRAAQRGGESEAPVRRSSAGAHALHDAPKNESQEEPETARALQLVDALDEAVENAKVAAVKVAEERFEKFWQVYPKRDGKRVGKAKAKAIWMRMTPEQHQAAWKGVHHYAASGWRPKDAERWLRDQCWLDWDKPAETGGGLHVHRPVEPTQRAAFRFGAQV